MKTRKISRGIIYTNNKNKTLFLIIKAKKGYWQFPQGGIENDETPKEALKREIYEETGLNNVNINAKSHYYIEYYNTRKGEKIKSKLHSYLVKTDYTNNIILSKEDGHTDFMWLQPIDIKTYITKYPEQLTVFNYMKHFLESSQSL